MAVNKSLRNTMAAAALGLVGTVNPVEAGHGTWIEFEPGLSAKEQSSIATQAWKMVRSAGGKNDSRTEGKIEKIDGVVDATVEDIGNQQPCKVGHNQGSLTHKVLTKNEWQKAGSPTEYAKMVGKVRGEIETGKGGRDYVLQKVDLHKSAPGCWKP